MDALPVTEPEPPGRDVSRILARLADQLGAMDDEPRTLSGGMTNRNLCVSFGGTATVVRICGKRTSALGIDRATEELATRQAAALGIAPRVLARLPDEDVLVCTHRPGRALTSEELRRPDRLVRLAGALRAFHGSAPLPTAFAVVPLFRAQVDLVGDVPAAVRRALTLTGRIDAALQGHAEHRPVPCHNDLLAANVIEHDDDMCLVDWEYAGMNDRFFDLANLAANNGLSTGEQRVLLDAYFATDGGATDRRTAAIEVMAIVSDLRETLWALAQCHLSELDDVDYGQYARQNLERLQTRLASPEIEEWITLAQTP